ncbi:hypothetical protein AU509_04320 [Lonsdalea britannica]|uniref:ATP-binding protein n=1 Tax=Lonsdalea britannica TaxID=1082704 RepID=A0AAD0SH90_9GAMM|nr:AAA family ATPase [Lonsdalea britannica]AXW87159.1 ATP-binding protein [Lonsdalea britannica]OSM99168.1 hypothetical protein AU509_04320 [Lonsdalea britannica]
MKIFLNEKNKINLESYILLQATDWDDYSYKSTFLLSFFYNDKLVPIGELKIIDSSLEIGRVLFDNGCDKLPDNFCSLGQSKQYYLNIRDLGLEYEKLILESLNDCAYDRIIFDAFNELSQFKTSAVRFSPAEQALEFAKKIFSRQVETNDENCHVFDFSTTLKGFSTPYNLNFSFQKQSKSIIPSNINVIIGRNGTGKTQLLSDIARTISGYGFDDKSELIRAREKRFNKTKPDFGNVVVVSYSAFDNFEIPGKNEAEQKEIEEQGHIFGYKYCGLRERIENSTEYRLKNISEITNEFKVAYEKIIAEKRIEQWNECIKPIVSDQSFSELDQNVLLEKFDRLSSGQKIVLSILANIFEHIKDNSLVIIDEPETHLHPSLIASFMHSIRSILTNFNSYSIIATHSPVILQETPSKFVQVLRGNCLKPKVGKLKKESFGEEISTLTEDVFNVSFEESNFYSILSRFSSEGYTLKDIEIIFGKKLGMTAKSFLTNLN